jgi:hypothetical protein
MSSPNRNGDRQRVRAGGPSSVQAPNSVADQPRNTCTYPRPCLQPADISLQGLPGRDPQPPRETRPSRSAVQHGFAWTPSCSASPAKRRGRCSGSPRHPPQSPGRRLQGIEGRHIAPAPPHVRQVIPGERQLNLTAVTRSLGPRKRSGSSLRVLTSRRAIGPAPRSRTASARGPICYSTGLPRWR